MVESFGRAGWDVPPPAALDVRLVADPGAVPRDGLASSSPSCWSRRPRSRCRRAPASASAAKAFVRIALVENEQRIRQAARNIRRFLETAPEAIAQRRAARARAAKPVSQAARIDHGGASLKVGVAGLGTVGAAVVRLIAARARSS